MNQTGHLLLVAVAAASVSIAFAQSPPVQSKPGYKDFALVVGTMVDTCPMQSENNFMKYQLKRISAAELVQIEKTCPAEKLATVRKLKAELANHPDTVSAECSKAADDLYIDAQVHWENFDMSPSESYGNWKRRIASEVSAIKSKATRTRLQC